MGDTAQKKTDGKCPDGYTEVWTWCFKKSVIDKLSKPLEDIKLPTFTDPSCEAALAALKGIENTLSNLMALPKKYLGMLGSLLNYPFDVAQSMLNSINKAMDQVSKAIDDLLKGAGFDDLIKAMDNILQCSFLADSDIGKLAASILDAVKNGTNVTGLLNDLKKMLNSTAQDALNNLKKTPTQALNNINKAIDNLIKQLGLDDIIKNMKKLEKCVDSLCKAFKNLEDFKDRVPTSADDLLKSGGMVWNSATQSVENAALSIAGQATGAVDTVTSVVTSTASSSLAGAVTGAATTVATATGSAVSGIVTSTTTVVGGVATSATNLVSTSASGVVSSATGAVKNAATSLVGDNVVGTASSVATDLAKAGTALKVASTIL